MNQPNLILIILTIHLLLIQLSMCFEPFKMFATKKTPNNPSPEEKAKMSSDNTNEKFTFFYHNKSPFSQFHPSVFRGRSLFPSPPSTTTNPENPFSKSTDKSDNESEVTFYHCEQWMMFNKAKLFNDEESASKILKARKPQECKVLGRGVKNFDLAVWTKHNVNIIYEGNRLKFTQNPPLLKALEKTEGTTLVEASPTDTIYGIGLSATNPKALSRKTWRGQNLLGETLTKLRENLKADKPSTA